MKTAKLMVVNASQAHNKHRIGQIFEAKEFNRGRSRFQIIPKDGFPAYSVNPVATDEDLTIRNGFGPDDVLFHLRRVSKASPRKLLVRALKVIARQRGYTDANIRKYGESANIGDWARQWADFYIDSRGVFNSCNTDWLHGTEHDPVNGHEFREFMESEFDAA